MSRFSNALFYPVRSIELSLINNAMGVMNNFYLLSKVRIRKKTLQRLNLK